MSSFEGEPLVLGRVSGFRGGSGEVTVKVVSGDAARWTGLRRVLVRGRGSENAAGLRTVASARAYRDRLVLKLADVNDASAAAALRGCDVLAPAEDVPALPEGVYWVARLVGARVVDAALGDIGRVTDVIAGGGGDLLLVEDGDGVETLVPLVKEFVTEIDASSGTIRSTIPDGLRGLNAEGGQERT